MMNTKVSNPTPKHSHEKFRLKLPGASSNPYRKLTHPWDEEE